MHKNVNRVWPSMMKSWMNFISFCFVLLGLPGISNFFYWSFITWTTRKIRSLVSTKERTRLWHQKRTEFEHWSSFTKSMTTFILLRLFSYWENEELIPHIRAPFLLFSLNTTTHTHTYMHTYPNSIEKCWERIHFTSIFNVWRRVYLFKG